MHRLESGHNIEENLLLVPFIELILPFIQMLFGCGCWCVALASLSTSTRAATSPVTEKNNVLFTCRKNCYFDNSGVLSLDLVEGCNFRGENSDAHWRRKFSDWRNTVFFNSVSQSNCELQLFSFWASCCGEIDATSFRRVGIKGRKNCNLEDALCYFSLNWWSLNEVE